MYTKGIFIGILIGIFDATVILLYNTIKHVILVSQSIGI